jgi:hypothetical protein
MLALSLSIDLKGTISSWAPLFTYTALAASALGALYQHSELRRELKQSSSTDKSNRIRKELILLWSVFFFAVAAAVSSQFASEYSEEKMQQKVSSVDPMGQTIKSAVAHVEFNFKSALGLTNAGVSAIYPAFLSLERLGKPGTASEANMPSLQLIAEKVSRRGDYRDGYCSIDFQWDSEFHRVLGTNQNETVQQVLDRIENFNMGLFFIPKDSFISNASISLVLNSSIEKVIHVSPQQISPWMHVTGAISPGK